MDVARPYIVTTTLGFALFLFIWTIVPGAAVDFNELERRETAEVDEQSQQSLLQQRNTLWEGEPDDLLFDVVSANGSLVWVSATQQAIHVSRDNGIGVFPGDLTEKMPGRILSLTVHPMPHLPDKILISTTIIDGNQLVTHLLSYNWREQTLRTFHRVNSKAVRPLGKFMYGQSYWAGDGWMKSIHQLRTTNQGYNNVKQLPLPSDVVLLQLERLSPRIISYINGNGVFRIVRGKNEIDRRKGNFGRSTRIYRHRANQQDKPHNQVRISPATIPSKNLVAVADNPGGDRGLLSFGNEDITSSITLFRWDEEDGITNQYRVGPLDGRVLDLEVSMANPEQLLWLRKTQSGSVSLEMIDFSQFRLR